MVWKTYSTPTTYQAELTFMLNEDDGGGGLGGVSAILGQFGIGGGGGGKFNLEKMFQLAKSRNIVQKALFRKIEIEGQKDYLVNHIIKIYDFHENWEGRELENFTFSHDSISNFSLTENRVLKIIHQRVVGNKESSGLLNFLIDDSDILMMRATTKNEELSIILTEVIYEELSNFYVTKSIERQKAVYNLVKSKTDSLQNALDLAQSRLLRFQDSNRGLSLQRYEAERLRLQQETQKLIVAYGESYRQLEVADFSLKSSTPIVQIIDSPILPLNPINPSKLMSFLTGLLLGTILGVAFIIGRKVLRDTLKTED